MPNNIVDDVLGDISEEVENTHTAQHNRDMERAAQEAFGTHDAVVDTGLAHAPEHSPEGEIDHPDEPHASYTPHDPSTNIPQDMHKEFMADIKKFGRASGEGASALPRLAVRVVRAAADGLISTEKPSGGGKDDASLIYEAYTAEDSKKSEHTMGGAKANASKLRQLISMGCMVTCDPVDVADRTIRKWREMVDADLKPKPLYAGLVDVARAQTAQDKALSDEAIGEALTKTPAEKTVEKEWKAIQKKVEALVTGENSAGLKDQSSEAIKVSELVGEIVSQFAVSDDNNAFIQMCVDRGYSRVQAEEMAKGRV